LPKLQLSYLPMVGSAAQSSSGKTVTTVLAPELKGSRHAEVAKGPLPDDGSPYPPARFAPPFLLNV
jgi:hypothetical protein